MLETSPQAWDIICLHEDYVVVQETASIASYLLCIRPSSTFRGSTCLELPGKPCYLPAESRQLLMHLDQLMFVHAATTCANTDGLYTV